MRKATNVARENLISLGTCFGKMTKSGKFRLHITALDFLAPYAKVLYISQSIHTSPCRYLTWPYTFSLKSGWSLELNNLFSMETMLPSQVLGASLKTQNSTKELLSIQWMICLWYAVFVFCFCLTFLFT